MARVTVPPRRVELREQVTEAMATLIETPYQYRDDVQWIERVQRRRAILATLKWLEENRDTVLQAHYLIKDAEEKRKRGVDPEEVEEV